MSRRRKPQHYYRPTTYCPPGVPEPARQMLDAVAAHIVDAGGPCPDCDADARAHIHETGIVHLVVEHDDTCPAYRGVVA